jgi:TatD DNase family protein
MTPLSYLDIHTHLRTHRSDSVVVASLSVEEILTQSFPEKFLSAGVHPWWLEDYTTDEIENLKAQIEKLLTLGKLWAVGETGIDRSSKETLTEQVSLFHWHLELSEKYGLPLIIHSVRSGSDFLQILNEKKPTSPWIFHDFRGNENLVKDLLRLHPDCYFSFGISLDNSSLTRELLPLVPLERVFFETDDQKHLDIHDIYLRASHFLGLDVDFLKSQTWMNFRKMAKFL